MKKFGNLLLILSAFILLFGSVSCRKCRTCYAEDYSAYYDFYYSEEYCTRSSSDLEDWEDDFRDTYSSYQSVYCSDN